MSATASAALRSSFPFRYARRVNSPGPAVRAPACSSERNVSRATIGLPWTCSSTTSSPVAVRGASIASASPRSITLPSTSRISPYVATRSRNASRLRKTRATIARASGPLQRTIAIAPLPGGVAIAAIVSVAAPPCYLGLDGRAAAGEAPLKSRGSPNRNFIPVSGSHALCVWGRAAAGEAPLKSRGSPNRNFIPVSGSHALCVWGRAAAGGAPFKSRGSPNRNFIPVWGTRRAGVRARRLRIRCARTASPPARGGRSCVPTGASGRA